VASAARFLTFGGSLVVMIVLAILSAFTDARFAGESGSVDLPQLSLPMRPGFSRVAGGTILMPACGREPV